MGSCKSMMCASEEGAVVSFRKGLWRAVGCLGFGFLVLYCPILLVPGHSHSIILAFYNPEVRKRRGAGEMAQCFRALTALPELSPNPSNHMVAHNHL